MQTVLSYDSENKISQTNGKEIDIWYTLKCWWTQCSEYYLQKVQHCLQGSNELYKTQSCTLMYWTCWFTLCWNSNYRSENNLYCVY